MTLLLLAGLALASDIQRAESFVLGANLTLPLGEPPAWSRLGFGMDLWYQMQLFVQKGEYVGEHFVVWARELPNLNYGPGLHVWRSGGEWTAGLEARAGVMCPLRMGLQDGWWPGPGLTLQAGPALSTRGHVGLDLQAAADLPWIYGRIGETWTLDGLVDRRLHLGLFSPLEQPHLWPDTEGAVWDISDYAP